MIHFRRDHMNTGLLALPVLLWLVSAASGDDLVLKSGSKYSGVITRSRTGEVALTTAKGTFTYKDEAVDFKLTSFAEPAEAQRAAALLKAKKYAEAKPLYAQMETRYRGLPARWCEEALFGLGSCQLNTDERERGVATMQALLDRFPNSRFRNEAEYWIIEMQFAGKPGVALEEKLVKLLAAPKTSDRIRARASMGLADIYDAKQDARRALEQYVNIVVLYGDIEELQQKAQHKCADLFLHTGRTNEAAYYYKQVVENYPNTDDAAQAKQQLSHITNQQEK